MDQLRRFLAHIARLDSVKRVRRNRCLLSNLAWQYCNLSHWRRRFDDDTRVPCILSSGDWAMPPLSSKKQKLSFGNSPLPPSRAMAPAGYSPLGKPEAPTTETNPFSVLGEKAPSSSSNSLEAKERSIRGKKPEDPPYPVQTTRTSPLPGHQDSRLPAQP